MFFIHTHMLHIVCVCVCVCIYMYTHTHTHTYTCTYTNGLLYLWFQLSAVGRSLKKKLEN